MPWKSEIDRLVVRALLDASRGGANEQARALRILDDLIALSPEREESHFHVGSATELLAEEHHEGLPESDGRGERWRHLGQLDAAARKGRRDRVRELMDDEAFDACLDHPEGRTALRAVGRMLLRDGEDDRIFGYYTRHLAAVDDEGSRRDAEFLLEEALRRADRYERGARDENESLARLDRVMQFAEQAGLEPRAGAKVDRKMGRVHQLGERWDEAVACYQRALERLPADDAYRSVLVGDLALATLGVRGTLDLLPDAERETRDDAIEILSSQGEESEGRSYNAIYTLGVLHYESGNFTGAAECFAEADALMRANRAKARIVHARSRFFLGHCMIENGADGEDFDQAQRYVQRDAGPSNLPHELKDVVFDALLEVNPDARVPGRGRGGRGRERLAPAAGALREAERVLRRDAHRALKFVDKAFKSKPDFDTWFGAYRVRLEALIALEERDEATATYERFRGKLYKGDAMDYLESLLLDEKSPTGELLTELQYLEELADLYEVMPGRDEQFVATCIDCARAYLEAGEADGLVRAQHMLREAALRDEEAVAEVLAEVTAAAKKKKVLLDDAPDEDACKEQLGAYEEPLQVLVVGGDDGRRPHLDSLHDVAGRMGFEGSWVFTGAATPDAALDEIEERAENASLILLHHRTDASVRDEVLAMAEEMELPVSESPWLGANGLQSQVVHALNDKVLTEE